MSDEIPNVDELISTLTEALDAPPKKVFNGVSLKHWFRDSFDLALYSAFNQFLHCTSEEKLELENAQNIFLEALKTKFLAKTLEVLTIQVARMLHPQPRDFILGERWLRHVDDSGRIYAFYQQIALEDDARKRSKTAQEPASGQTQPDAHENASKPPKRL